MLNKDLDPGSRPESQRFASCANRLVVTSGAYRGDAGMDPGSRNALEMVRALWIILIIFLTENGALPISKRTRNSADTMVYL